MTKREYHLVDLIKLIGAIMIFAMHSSAFGDNKQLQLIFECCSRWAVPFFFIVSSFFLCGKLESTTDDERKAALKGYVKRILILYCLWAVFNIPSIIVRRIIVPGPLKISTWINFLKGALISSTFTGSWYLVSCIFSAWFCYWLLRTVSIKRKLLVSGFFQVACILCSAYLGVLPERLGSFLHNGLSIPLGIWGGVFYFSVGEAVFRKNERLAKTKKWILILCAVIFYGLYFCEIYYTKKLGILDSTDYSVFIAPAAMCITILALRTSIVIKRHRLCRKLSTIIYCSQSNLLLIPAALGKLGIESHIVRFGVCCIFSAVICVIVLKLQKAERYKWAKYLT